MQPSRSLSSIVLAEHLFAVSKHAAVAQDPWSLQVASAMELSLAQLRTVLHVWRSPSDLSVHEIADAIGRSAPATVRLIDGLIADGLVTRQEDPSDRRVKRITLTEHGKQSAEQLVAAKRESFERFSDLLLEDEREQLTSVLQPILERLGTPAFCGGSYTEIGHENEGGVR